MTHSAGNAPRGGRIARNIERYGHTMKVTQHTKRAAAWSLSALMLSSVLLCSVACTRNDNKNPGDTTAGQTVTTPATGNNGTGSKPDKPMNPDAGTVAPNGDAGDPPAGTDGGTEGRSFRSHFMH